MSDPAKNAATFLAQATEFRLQAEASANLTIRAQLLRMAQKFEELAAQAEAQRQK